MLLRTAFYILRTPHFNLVYIAKHCDRTPPTRLIDSPPCGRGVSGSYREVKSVFENLLVGAIE